MKYLRLALPVLAVALVLASCAAKLPQADVDAANAAFAEAKTAQADVLAADSYTAASAANDALQANLNAKDYGKTKALAKALLDASAKAKADAATGLDAAKTNVAQLGTDIAAEVASIQKNLKAAVAKKAKVDAKAIKAGLAAEPKALADAQAQTDVVASQTALKALKASLDGFKAALEAAGFKD
jgi:colicin import membrane protein